MLGTLGMYSEAQLFDISTKARMLMDLIVFILIGFILVQLEANNMP